jgi:hypothetical protein
MPRDLGIEVYSLGYREEFLKSYCHKDT